MEPDFDQTLTYYKVQTSPSAPNPLRVVVAVAMSLAVLAVDDGFSGYCR